MRRGGSLLVLAVAAAVTVCGGAGPVAAQGRDPFAAVHRSMQQRVRADRLDGGMVLVMRGDEILDRRSYGSLDGDTVVPIASASKWLTAATLMTLVDEGRLTLDDPVADHLPGFDGAKRSVKVRHLLSHTSGLAYDACVGAASGTTTAACTARIAAGPDPSAKPGTEFVYSSVGYEVAARLVEVLTGQSFTDAFAARIAGPLGMTRTRFDRYGSHPVPAASATSSVDDYARFVGMMANHGVAADGRRILSADAVDEIERDQVRGIDTRGESAVQTTGIPTYGLGIWRDVVGPDDEIRVLSGSGAFGFYPWIDRRHDTWGIIGVADTAHGADHAVPASQRQARMAWRAAASLD
jgi:CubicO group peptidase (beta-lactamase class C family)